MLLEYSLHIPDIVFNDKIVFTRLYRIRHTRWISQSISNNINAKLINGTFSTLYQLGYFYYFIILLDISRLKERTIHSLTIERHKITKTLLNFAIIHLTQQRISFYQIKEIQGFCFIIIIVSSNSRSCFLERTYLRIVNFTIIFQILQDSTCQFLVIISVTHFYSNIDII